MKEYKTILSKINKNKEKIYFIHYSCQSLSDDNEGYSPRITSIAILHMQSLQMHSFSMHLVAEQLDIKRDDILDHYDEIEKKMLETFFDFLELKKDDYIWIHWNMTNINFGFEALEHRYKVLTSKTAIHIEERNKYNLSSLLKKKYGSNYSKDPKMLNLMLLNQKVKNRNFLTGKEEVAAYKAVEFVKLHNSTMCKVYFFNFVFEEMNRNKLRTETNQVLYKINEIYQNPFVQILGIIGIIGTLVSLVMNINK